MSNNKIKYKIAMKKIFVLLLLSFVLCLMAYSQKIAVIDMKSVLAKMPEYASISVQIERMTATWNDDIANRKEALKLLQNEYDSDSLFYTDKLKSNKQKELKQKKQELDSMQRYYFGIDGQLFKQKEALLQPLQVKVYNVLEKIAADRAYDLLIDKSVAGTFLLYVDPKLDITLRVIQLLGF